MVRTSPELGRTVDHLYSFNLDQSRPLDHWSGPSGALGHGDDADMISIASYLAQEVSHPCRPTEEDVKLVFGPGCSRSGATIVSF